LNAISEEHETGSNKSKNTDNANIGQSIMIEDLMKENKLLKQQVEELQV